MANNWVPLEELKTTREWVRLSPTQRTVLEKYISNGYDREAAVKEIFKCSTLNSTRTTINRVFGNADLKAILSVHFAESELDKFKNEVRRVLNSKKVSTTRVAALRVLAKASGFNVSALSEMEAVAAEEKVVAEKIIERDGKKYRTTVTEVAE